MKARPALINRHLDFWLIGGASILVWGLMIALNPLRKYDSHLNKRFVDIPVTMAALALFVNFPHFMASYKLAYGKGFTFIKQNWLQLLVVPLVMIGIFVASFVFAGPDVALSKDMMGWLAQTLFLTVGWHYTKQAFGCSMVYSHYDGYSLTPLARNLLKANLLGVWLVSFARGNVQLRPHNFHSLSLSTWGIPDFAAVLCWIFFVISFLGFCYYGIYENYRKRKQKPSLNFLIPWLSMIIWWLPIFVQNDFYRYVVPFFHSLQYMPFVYKMEEAKNSAIKLSLIGFLLIVFGYLSFEAIPENLDRRLGLASIPDFFLMCSALFLNIHHYFIDNVLWRFKNPDVRQILLK